MELTDDLVNEIFGDLAADLVDLDDDQIKDKILTYGLSPEDMKDVFDTVKAVQEAEAASDAGSSAQQMANEDQTAVKVTEEDKDLDGDTDKVTVEKQETEDDDGVKEVLDYFDAPDNSSESEDKPHDESDNKTNHFAKLLSEHRF